MTEIKVWVQKLAGRQTLFLQWHDPETGKRRTKSAGTTDPVEAKRACILWEEALRKGGRPGSPQLSWASFRELYAAEILAGQRESTREKAGAVFDVLEVEVAPQKLVNLNERTLSRLVVKLRSRVTPGGKVGLEPITIRNYLVCIRAALAWAKSQRMIPELPTFPRIKVPKKKPQPVSEKEFALFLEAAPDAIWRAYFLCGWWSGLRLSEAMRLRRSCSERWPWLDLEANRIVLPAAFAKSCEDQWVPLHQTLRTALAALSAGNELVFDLRGPSGRPMTRHAITNKIARIAMKAHVRLSMHRLRKGFGCRVAQQLGRGNAPVLHTLMRHSSMQVTMDYYASTNDVLQEAMRELK